MQTGSRLFCPLGIPLVKTFSPQCWWPVSLLSPEWWVDLPPVFGYKNSRQTSSPSVRIRRSMVWHTIDSYVSTHYRPGGSIACTRLHTNGQVEINAGCIVIPGAINNIKQHYLIDCQQSNVIYVRRYCVGAIISITNAIRQSARPAFLTRKHGSGWTCVG